MGNKTYEINENDIINFNYNSVEDINEEIVSKTSFQYKKVIGRGGFGKVWKVIHKKSKNIYAMKEISKVKVLFKKSEISIKNERTLLSKMFHPFIINMHYSFQDDDNLYLVMDYLSGGDLRYQYCLDKDFNEEQTKFFICCILLSLEYIHSNNILHRDIKPENLIFDGNGYLKLTDFGIAKIYNKNIDNSKDNSGTLGYMAPEVLFNYKQDYRCDYYGVGIVGYELMAHQRPYNFMSRKEAQEKILKKEAKISRRFLRFGWSLNYLDFINKLLKTRPDERLGKNGIEEIKSHPWLKFFNWKDLYLMKIKAPFIPSKADNFDAEYCNEKDIISEETKMKYMDIKESIRYKFIFDDYKYYDRRKDYLINRIINKEKNITIDLTSLFKNKKGKKKVVTRNKNGSLDKITWKKYTMDNLNNMISEYKSMDLEKNINDEKIYDNEDIKYQDFDIINEIKPCTNPHMVYRALEQKEKECLSNDEENKFKNKTKYSFKSQSPLNRNNKKNKTNKVSRNLKPELKSFKSIPINIPLDLGKIKINNIQENGFISNRINSPKNDKLDKIDENKLNVNNEMIEEQKNNKNNKSIKVRLLVNKNYKNDKIDLEKTKYNNYIKENDNKDIIRVRKNKNLSNKIK